MFFRKAGNYKDTLRKYPIFKKCKKTADFSKKSEKKRQKNKKCDKKWNNLLKLNIFHYFNKKRIVRSI